MKAILDKLTSEPSASSLDGEPTLKLLRTWAFQNLGREVTNQDLCAGLAELAEKTKVTFPYKGNHRGFAQHMSQLRSNLERVFLITERSAGGRKTFFTFTLKQEEYEP
jgi:hypothetical protein